MTPTHVDLFGGAALVYNRYRMGLGKVR